MLSGLQAEKEERAMALTRDFRETVQARVRGDQEFRRGLLSDAVESLLAGEAALGRVILRDFINATLGFPALAERTGIHVKTLHQMFGPKGNPTAANLFNIIACLQEHEGVRLQVVASARLLRRRLSPPLRLIH
jgi:DNA-binding phage protein